MIDFSKLNKILYLPTLSKSVKYYRIDSYLKYMRQDVDSTIACFTIPDVPEDFNSWELQIDVPEIFNELEDLVSKADLIITQSIHTRKAIAFLYAVKHKYGTPIYAEFDDDPYSLSSQHPHFDRMAPGSECELWADDLVKFTDGIITSTEYLKDRLERYNKNIIVIPNGIDFDIWDEVKVKKRSKKLEGKINIGWVGGGNHFEDLELIERPIKDILSKYPEVRFTIAIGNELPFYFRRNKQIIPYDFRDWVDIDEYPSFIKNLHLDIGIAPLRDNYHNRAKSNLKWLEFSSMGIPTVASPVEPYKNTSALLANTEDEWFNHLEELILNEKLRKSLGTSSRELVKEKFDVSKISLTYMDKLKEIIKESKDDRPAVQQTN